MLSTDVLRLADCAVVDQWLLPEPQKHYCSKRRTGRISMLDLPALRRYACQTRPLRTGRKIVCL